MPTYVGSKCSLWVQSLDFQVLEARGGPGDHLPAERGGWAHQGGLVLQIPQFYPFLAVFIGGCGLRDVCLRSAAGISRSPPPFFLKNGAMPGTTFVCVPLPVFSHLSEAWSTDCLVVVKINSESFYLHIKPPYPAVFI